MPYHASSKAFLVGKTFVIVGMLVIYIKLGLHAITLIFFNIGARSSQELLLVQKYLPSSLLIDPFKAAFCIGPL